MRFVIRMAQRNWLRKQKKPNNQEDETMNLVFEFNNTDQEELDMFEVTLPEGYAEMNFPNHETTKK